MPEFTENWYPDQQLRFLMAFCKLAQSLEGINVEIGCWEGRSTIGLAKICAPNELHAVDHWLGNDEWVPGYFDPNRRDVFDRFLKNIAPYPNVVPHRMSWEEFFESETRPVLFAHLDAGHSYQSTRSLIEMVKPLVVPGGVLCGDDFANAHANAEGLGGGVEMAVRDTLPGFTVAGNLWIWRNKVDE